MALIALVACGSSREQPEPARPIRVMPIAMEAGVSPAAEAEVARGEIVASLMDESGTLVTFSTRHDPTALVRPCIDDPELAPRPLSPTWMLFSIAIDYSTTTVQLHAASANNDAAQKLAACVAKALERVGNAQGLSRGAGRLVAYVSVR